MEKIAVREFRLNPAKVWRRLRKSGRMLITSSGRPIALITDIQGSDLETELRADALARGIVSASQLRTSAARNSLTDLTSEEIEEEIRAARKHNPDRRPWKRS